MKKSFTLASVPMLVLALLAGCAGNTDIQNNGTPDTDVNGSAAVGGTAAGGDSQSASNSVGDIITDADGNIDTDAIISEILSSGGNSASETVEDDMETTIVEYKKKDLEETFTESGSTLITGNGDSTVVSGSGASVDGNTVTITEEGTYILSGTINDGQIIVNTDKESDVRLILNGIDMSCSYSSPIYGISSDKIIITIAEGTVNNLSDGSAYVYENEGEDEPNAVIFSKDDMTINGTGTLNITGNYEHGIRTKDDLIIVSGSINITAVGDGLKGKDSVTIRDGSFVINSGADGIKASNDTDETKGYIVIEGGSFDITAACDGIQAITSLEILGGSFTICTGGGSANASTDSGGFWGSWGSSSSSDSETGSAKGLKADGSVYIAAGVIVIDSSDDSIHTNGDLTVSGGTIRAISGDDGMHADASLTINSGDIAIQKAYEGIEGLEITINGGQISVAADDDGLNAAGGDGSSLNGRPGMNQFASTEGAAININGGTLYINATGDGIDSNGDFFVNDGTVIVNGPTDSGNGVLDHNGEAAVYGGTVLAFGSSGMIENFGNTSTQNVLLIYFNSNLAAGTVVNISDSTGNEILSASAAKTSQCVIVSSPDLKTGETYVVSTGGTAEGTAENGYYGSAAYSGGTELCSVTINSTISSNGNAGGGNFNGFGGGKGNDKMPEGGMTPPDGTVPGNAA